MRIAQIFAVSVMLTWSTPTLAYVGPGLGLGTVGIVLAFIFSILLAIISLFWYPLKRLLEIGRSRNKTQNNNEKPKLDE